MSPFLFLLLHTDTAESSPSGKFWWSSDWGMEWRTEALALTLSWKTTDRCFSYGSVNYWYFGWKRIERPQCNTRRNYQVYNEKRRSDVILNAFRKKFHLQHHTSMNVITLLHNIQNRAIQGLKNRWRFYIRAASNYYRWLFWFRIVLMCPPCHTELPLSKTFNSAIAASTCSSYTTWVSWEENRGITELKKLLLPRLAL